LAGSGCRKNTASVAVGGAGQGIVQCVDVAVAIVMERKSPPHMRRRNGGVGEGRLRWRWFVRNKQNVLFWMTGPPALIAELVANQLWRLVAILLGAGTQSAEVFAICVSKAEPRRSLVPALA
jgi:hypothetical protein